MTIGVYISDNEHITIRHDDNSSIHLGQQHHAIDSWEPIMKVGSMIWKAGMQILKFTSSPEGTPEENELYIAMITDAHGNNIAEMDINKATYNFFRDNMDDILANKKPIAEGFD